MTIPTKLLLTDLLKHNVRCENGIDHGPGIGPWMHPPVHRILGWISRPSNLRLQREVWRLDQIRGIGVNDIYVKGDPAISDLATLNRFPTLIQAGLINSKGSKIGFIADFLFEILTAIK